ncbi:MAG: hypothetical protein PUJ79_07500, partial [Helicobacter sp.]|nr:hypothetical protein [Helicobacter sp.]MDY5740785.1 hypothetical protein [Helicobacter sp.]
MCKSHICSTLVFSISYGLVNGVISQTINGGGGAWSGAEYPVIFFEGWLWSYQTQNNQTNPYCCL